MRKKVYILLYVFISINILSAQTLNSILKNGFKNNEQVILNKKDPINKNKPLEYFFCDQDDDGFVEIDIANLQTDVIPSVSFSEKDAPSIVVSTITGNVLKIKDFSSANPIIELICQFDTNLSDIAVDENKNYYITNFLDVFKVDEQTCESTQVIFPVFNDPINSLSFDKQGFLYYGHNNPRVYKYDINGASVPFLWHDFGTGGAGGDFVEINGKIYISWRGPSNFRLYEVTVDNDNNYISHEDLGQIPSETFGLAAEYGKLYGVTRTQLYEIDLNTFTFETIINNDLTYGTWSGAAGLHEAINTEVSSFISYTDALNENNPLPGNWTNTVSNEQIIYVRTENLSTGEYIITEVLLKINIPPSLDALNTLDFCENTSSDFSLREINNQLINNTDNLTFSFYESIDNAQNTTSALGLNSVIIDYNALYIRAHNTITGCYNILLLSDLINFDIKAPHFFTPNNDGYFDTWYIEKLKSFPETQVFIYDRYGKLIKTLTSNSSGWDGTINGVMMPTSDYWYITEVKCGEKVLMFKGHFSLKL